jgi:hypothetical protein
MRNAKAWCAAVLASLFAVLALTPADRNPVDHWERVQ